MTTIKVATLNTQNKFNVKNYDGGYNSIKFSNLLKDYNIDILSTQELVRRYLNNIKNNLPTGYKGVGNYRYGNFYITKKIKFLDRYNETNTIFTKHKVILEKDVRLPWIPRTLKDLKDGLNKYKSITPRIITEAVIEIDNKKVRILNTHLDKRIENIKRRQLKRLITEIQKKKIPTIITGDFNLGTDDPLMQEFINTLSKQNIVRVPYNNRTFKYSNKDIAIDHIFISKDFNLKKFGIIDYKYFNDFSDHYPLYAELEFWHFLDICLYYVYKVIDNKKGNYY